MHRHRFDLACPALALAFLFSCRGLRPADVPLQHPTDPWLEGHARVSDELRHKLCQQHRSFIGVGDLPGGEFGSGASGVSRDGKRVAGKSTSDTPAGQGFTWTHPASGLKFWPTSPDDGIQPLGFYVPPGGEPGIECEATQVSADGRVAVGASKTADARWHAVKWTEGGVELVPEPTGSWVDRSSAFGVSGDGAVISGMGTHATGVRGFRWTAARGTELLTQVPAGSALDSSWANGTSDDGTTIAGRIDLDGEADPLPRACAWRSSAPGGDLTLHVLSADYSEAYNASADGSVVVGYASNGVDFNIEACWWEWTGSAYGPAQFLGQLAGTAGSLALDVDAEGKAVSGYCYSDTADVGAVWFPKGALHTPGPHPVWGLLSAAGITAHSGWSLDVATGVTIDPVHRVLVLVGGGINPDQHPEGWVAHVPPWCLTPRPPLREPNVPHRWPEPWTTRRGSPIDPLGGGPP